MIEPKEFLALLLDASQFIAGAIADGYGDQEKAQRLARSLADIAGEGPAMARVLSQVSDRKRENSRAFAKSLERTTRRLCVSKLLTDLGRYKTELEESARHRAAYGDESAELAFLSAAERLVEIVLDQIPAPVATEPEASRS